MRLKLIMSLTIAMIVFSCQEAFAYYYLVRTGCKSGGVIKSRVSYLRLNNVSFPDGSSWEKTFVNALNEFNTDIPGSGWRFSWGKEYDSRVGWDDGTSEVAFMTGANMGSSAPAYTKWWYDYDWSWGEFCYYIEAIDEADVLFNVDYSWSSSLYDSSPFDSIYNLKAVALHELGHVTGLQHENRRVATMGSGSYAYFGTNRNSPRIHSDDKAGERFLYGNGVTNTDVAVHAFKQTSTSGEYGSVGYVSQDTSVARGNYLKLEYTMENHGTTRVDNVKYGFYIYQNWSWRLLGTSYVWMDPGYVGTFTRYLYIPSDITPGYSYQFKVVADSGNVFSESNESNNETIFPSKVYIQ